MSKSRNFFFNGISREIPMSEFLGNSVAIPCVEFIMMGIAAAFAAAEVID